MQHPLDGMTWADSVREVEALGYSTIFVPDHFDEGLGPIAAMATAAAVTTTLNVGSLVFDCDYRHPAVLARELATIDLLSGGRLEVGLGAGWKQLDYERSGIAMDIPRVRVDRMIEHVTVMKALFADEPVTFKGEHYTITDLDGTPKPHRSGGPPFILAGGAKRVLSFAARTADIVGINASIHSGAIDTAAAHDAMPASIDRKSAWVKEAAGERYDELEINAWLSVAEIVDDTMGFAEMMSGLFEAPAADILDSPLTLIGSVPEVIERLHARRERWGYSYTVVPGDKVRDFAPVVEQVAGR